MKARIAVVLFLATILVAFVQTASAEPLIPKHPPARVTAAREAAGPIIAQPQPTGDPLRAGRHPEEALRGPATARNKARALSQEEVMPQAAATTGAESEPNNTPAQAGLITAGDILDGVISLVGDVDYYQFSVAPGDILRFAVVAHSAGSAMDADLTLYSTDGMTKLAYSDDYTTPDPLITYLFPSAGTFYVAVADFNDDEGGAGYYYKLQMYNEGAANTTLLRASVNDRGEGGWGYSESPALSASGRYVAFHSGSHNLVPNDLNERRDVFVRDTETNTVERVSVRSDGEEANGDSYHASISADGRYVAFYSWADNLVDDDDNLAADVFVHDRDTGETTRISVSSSETEADRDSYDPVISADGRFVAFYSYATDLVDDDANEDLADIFVRDLTNGTTTLVSRHSNGTQGDEDSYYPAISADGQFVAFSSDATNLVDSDSNGTTTDIFVRDLTNGTTTLVSRHSDGTQGNSDSYEPAISGDGQMVAYYSYADNLVDDDTNDTCDVFVSDLQNPATSLVSRHSDGTLGNDDSSQVAISADGGAVSFTSEASNLVDNDENGYQDIFIHDLATSKTTRVSESIMGMPGNRSSSDPALSADGHAVAFSSTADNLVLFDSTVADIFVRYSGVTLHAITGEVTVVSGLGMAWTMVSDTSGAAVLTGEDGTYVLTRLLPGQHGVKPWDDSYTYLFPEPATPVTLPPTAAAINFVATDNTYEEESFSPSADAYVDQATKTANYGAKPYLRVKDAAADMNTYLRFDVSGISCPYIAVSRLELFTRDPGLDGGRVYSTGGNWTETGINWNNAPGLRQSMGSFGEVYDEAYNTTWVTDVSGNGTYNYVVQNDSADLVQYDSREGANHPNLVIGYRHMPESLPDADYYTDRGPGLAPRTIQFTDLSQGCPTSWAWDFGDGTTSTLPNPSHAFTQPGMYKVRLTVTNSAGVAQVTRWLSIYAPPGVFDLSPTGSGTVGGIAFTNADILRYNKAANSWMMIYDGSARGTPKNINAFAWDGNDLLLTFGTAQVIPGLGTATPFDVVRFSPTTPSVFPLGPGTYSWHFRGQLNGLTTSAEYIDAFDLPSGSGEEQYFSTAGLAAVGPGGEIKAQDEDVLQWLTWDHSWADGFALDGSAVRGLAVEDVNGLWYDPLAQDLYITILGSFNLGGVTGNGKSIIRLEWGEGAYIPHKIEWLALGATFPSNIDAIDLRR